MRMSNEMIVFSNIENACYTSVKAETKEDKVKLYNISTNPDYKVADMINKVIAIKDVYAEVIKMSDKETGELYDTVRIILIDKDGKSYQSISKGIYNSIQKIMALMGPPTWEDPIKVEVKQITRGSGNEVRHVQILQMV